MTKKNFLITIVGPTAIGKTSLGIAIAKHFQTEILSCDSRQFFKEMTIGTAVPTKDELQSAPHHFIQTISIHDSYSVGDYEKDALDKLDDLFFKNNIQILVGGSGLYVDAVLKGFDYFPDIDEDIRKSINNLYEIEGLVSLQQRLKDLDPEYYSKLALENPQTLQNPQRMKRFIEVCIGTGKPYSSFLGNNNSSRNFIPIIIGLCSDREIMYERINQRVDNMIVDGLLDEVKSLLPHKKLNALQTVGYREFFDFLENKISLEEAIDQVKINTRRFAKRQMTWFKRTQNITWFDYKTPLDDVILLIKNQIDSH